MSQTERPQTYLVTPPEFDLDTSRHRLAAVLDGAEIACLRLALASRDEDRLARAAAPIFSPSCGCDRMIAGPLTAALRKPCASGTRRLNNPRQSDIPTTFPRENRQPWRRSR
jgi:hypothetical protein